MLRTALARCRRVTIALPFKYARIPVLRISRYALRESAAFTKFLDVGSLAILFRDKSFERLRIVEVAALRRPILKRSPGPADLFRQLKELRTAVGHRRTYPDS